MPLKLNIAISRRSENETTDLGATVGLEMEVDSSLVDQPRELHRRIGRLFRLAKASVDRELAAQTDASVGAAADAGHPAERPPTKFADSRDREPARLKSRRGNHDAIWRLPP